MEGKTMKIWPLVGMLAVVALSIISVFLPLATMGSKNYSSLITDSGGEAGRIVIIAAVAVGILAVLALFTKKTFLSKIAGVFSILGALVLAGVGAIAYFAVERLSASPATGIYLVFVGAALFLIMGIASMRAKKN
ncbi:hypothetical protein [Candidatus Enterococcus clewellii]|uniref:Uncharacterized protein n=1 Tax=Candidatus Enterococcus clewellii TaxID=1834193 RepID=A0A242K6V8_9ENTE|nr:hypothetical protein [Enterococcus sp. 9E7_DIV0242]OTP16052.1 hypothetical protein A5888_002266 [Enterococcus sp. 9E7_DIV0242]